MFERPRLCYSARMPDTVLPVSVAATPRVLWVELTSRCPFDCIFCSRKLRRGSGEHMPFAVYEALIGSLRDPRTVVLNYSGESTVHPDLIAAIGLARGAGAFVELVSALAHVPNRMLAPLATSGLGRLTVSFHAIEPVAFREIYRHASVEALRERLSELCSLTESVSGAPTIDIGFVAMRRNLDQLAPVAEYSARLGIKDVLLFPVMRRDEIPVTFGEELSAPATPTEAFRAQVRETVAEARRRVPESRFTICNPLFEEGGRHLDRVPRTYPWPLPEGAAIQTCEQNPFETTHVLANGDVVACEVLDRFPLGNLHHQSMESIWNNGAYRRFRERYQSGDIPECRKCVWKKAWYPAPLESRILARTGGSAQLLHGWHEAGSEAIVWSSQQAAAILKAEPGSTTLHVCGALPPGPAGQPNRLDITCNSREIGSVTNPWGENMPFGLDFQIPSEAGTPWNLGFRTSYVCRPRERGMGDDQRDLGFALSLAVSKPPPRAEPSAARWAAIERARRWIDWADTLGRKLPRARYAPGPARTGVSILIPERGNPDELAESLASAFEACGAITEPWEILAVVNGSRAEAYDPLRRRFPGTRWIFRSEPLGYDGAVHLGLLRVRHGWTYLLNNDAAMRNDALAKLLPLRGDDVFAISSQIFFKDTARFREETNLSAMQVEDGLASVHDVIPESNSVSDSAYAGGGASLFRTSLLGEFVRDSRPYSPFYWEDVEWGWRARKLGLRVLFCPESIVCHRHRATIAKFHSPEEIDRIIERNRLLFHLRNLTANEFTERVLREVACSPSATADELLSPAALLRIARARIWNHRSPVEEARLLVP